jgi:hypothetical protein
MRKMSCILFTIAVAMFGSFFYPGQFLTFFLFSVTFFAVLFSVVFLPFQYSHFFLAIPWFLGFWLKVVVHLVFAYCGLVEAARYAEPSGKFDGAPGAWDQVLIIASVGGLGYLCGRILLAPLVVRSGETRTNVASPAWYRILRTPLWLSVVFAFVAIIYTNAETGLIVRGYVPKIQLPWPFGALFAWTTDIGFALVLSVLTAWDRGLGVSPMRGFVALCIEGAIVSIQTSSRGIYLFHTSPIVVSEARRPIAERSPISKNELFLVIWLAGAIAIPLLTSGLRALGDDAVLARTAAQSEAAAPGMPTPSGRVEAAANQSRFKSAVIRAFQGTSRLIVDRWPGIEGLMATQSYPDRGLDLMRRAAFQRRGYGMVDIYTQTIARSDFTPERAKKYHNATIAGPMAFLYFSDSRLVVFVGTALLAMLMSVLELLWKSLVPDALVLAISGFYLALVVMQISTGILQAASGPLAVTILLAAVWVTSRLSRDKASPRHERV